MEEAPFPFKPNFQATPPPPRCSKLFTSEHAPKKPRKGDRKTLQTARVQLQKKRQKNDYRPRNNSTPHATMRFAGKHAQPL